MRILFLDIDGVLNSETWFAGREQKSTVDELDPVAVARLPLLIDQSEASVVISSSWRLLYRQPALQRTLERAGLRSRIAGVTPAIPKNKGRGEEVQRWLDVVPSMRGWAVEGMVILDDDQDMLHLDPWLVQTTCNVGLTEADVERALSISSDRCRVASSRRVPGRASMARAAAH